MRAHANGQDRTSGSVFGRRLAAALLAALVAMGAASPQLAVAVTGDAEPAATLSLASDPTSGPAAAGSPSYSDTLIVRLRDGATALPLTARLAGATDADWAPMRGGTMRLHVPDGRDAAEFAGVLRLDSEVACVDLDWVRQPAAHAVPPNDPAYADPTAVLINDMYERGVYYQYARSWWLRDLSAETLWSSLDDTTSGVRAPADAVRIAVIDSGLYLDHPDRGANAAAGRDEFETYTGATGVLTKDDDVTPADPGLPNNSIANASHGTAVSGVAAAATDNGTGVPSLGYEAQVAVYKIGGVWLDFNTAVYPSGIVTILDQAVIDAIYHATDDGCRVINLSMSGPAYSQAMQDAVTYAWEHGVLVIACTGNAGSTAPYYPAGYDHVLGVGSYNLYPQGQRIRSSFSNYGPDLDVLAPGVGIWGLTMPGYDADGAGTSSMPGYTWLTGTSFSAPIVSAAAATLMRYAPSLGPDEIAELLLRSARPVGAQPSAGYGYGFLDVNAALARLRTAYPYLTAPTGLAAYSPDGATAVAWWSPVAGREVSYAVAVDGATATVTTGTRVTVALPASGGDHTVTVTPMSDFNWWDAAVSATTSVLPRTSGTVRLLTSASRATYGDTVWTLAYLKDATGAALDGSVTLEVCEDGVTWRALGTVPQGAGLSFPLLRTTLVRARYAGDDIHAPVTSAITNVACVPHLSAPRSVSTVRYRSRLSVSGFLAPAHPVGGREVLVQAYRYESGRWRLRGSWRAIDQAYTAGATRYAASFALPSRGAWRLRAYYTGTPAFAPVSTGYRYVRVW